MAGLGHRAERALKARTSRYLRWSLTVKRRFRPRARCVFVAAAPKSGSTYLAAALAEATGFLPYFLGASHLNEQDLYLPRLLDVWSLDIVCAQHARASQPNLALLSAFSIRPVVLVRDLGDSLVSLRDHLERETPITPIFDAGERFLPLPREAQLDALVDLVAPWYLAFHAGWARAPIETLLLTYDELISDPAGTVARAATFAGAPLKRAPEEAVARVRRTKTRYNRGYAGRGAAQLSDDQRARLARLAAHYDDVDFSPLGIAAENRRAELKTVGRR